MTGLFFENIVQHVPMLGHSIRRVEVDDGLRIVELGPLVALLTGMAG
jgi:hypothetical protein